MKKTAIVLAVVAVLLCVVLAGCGGNADNGTTSSGAGINNNTTTTGNGFMDTTPREEGNTISEFFSEAASDMGDGSFLDPQNGIISDTQAY